MKVGILALQGAFIEHEKIIQELGAEVVEIRQRKDLEGIDGLILPGGESTVQGKLLRQLGLLKPIQQLINEGLPVLATCAGLILLAKTIDQEETAHLGTLPIVIKRNAYGRQLASFDSDIDMRPIGHYPAIFIRAPYIES
ncbi:pyridoxal 5'-phosphate synthase glutaminase subunit PdxT, partial [uncultured Sharpea sp.]